MSIEDKASLVQSLKEIVTNIKEINKFQSMIPQRTSFFMENPNPSNAEDLQNLQKSVEKSYDEGARRVQNALSIIREIIKKQTTSPNEQPLPTPEETNDLLFNLFKGKPKTKSPPMPNYCGCYVYKSKQPLPNQFICANLGDNLFVLMIVYRYNEEEKIVYAYDPSTPVKIIELRENQWTLLPTILPNKPNARWEHPKGKLVLSLRPINDEWSHNFYPAEVVSRPCDKAAEYPDEIVRGYVLDFDDAHFNVPEQFVVNYPDNWKKGMI